MYMSYIANTYSTKNRLEKAVAEFLQSNNRILISKDKIVDFKTKIIEGISQLNQNHDRCNPIEVYWDERYTDTKDAILRISNGICRFQIHHIRKEYSDER